MNVWDVELAKRARRCQANAGEDPWAIALPKLNNESPPPVSTPDVRVVPGTGMKWQVAMKRVEEHVRAHDGVFPSVKRLAEIVGCDRRTIDKAVEKSPYLKARQAESRAKRSVRTVPLSDCAVDEVSQGRDAELARLAAEQKEELEREERQAMAAKKRRS
jgi:hypothetical protein